MKKPETVKIKHSSGQELYLVDVKRILHFNAIWGEKEREEYKTETVIYAVGNLEDVKDYYELKYPDKKVEIKKISLDYELNVMVITSGLGKKARELRDLEKKVKEESQKI